MAAGISLDIKSELPKAIKWTNAHTKQLPFSISQAMNASAKGMNAVAGSKQRNALQALAGASKQYLDRPKPATSTGFRATTANKRNLSLLILPKDKPWSRNRYLSGNILGGTRAPKPFEIAFAAKSKGDILKGQRFEPTKFVKTDKFGNVRKSTIDKLISNVGTTNRTASGNVFIGKPRGGNRRPGVYRRERNHKLRPLFLITPAESYRSRFPATKVVATSVQRTFGKYLRQQLLLNVRAEMKR